MPTKVREYKFEIYRTSPFPFIERYKVYRDGQWIATCKTKAIAAQLTK